MRKLRHFSRFAILALIVAVMSSLAVAFAASNTIGTSGASDSQHNVAIGDLAPPSCKHINFTNLVTTWSSTYRWNGQTVYVFQGTTGNDLFIGTVGYDDFNASDGNDCMIGGGGIDYYWAGAGNDVCLANGSDDVFYDCESQQIARAMKEAVTPYERRPAKR